METIEVKSKIASRTLEPFVELHWGEMGGELTPTEARQHALLILAAADAAESDSFVAQYFGTMPGATMQDIAEVIRDFRHFREKLQAQERGS